MGPVHLFALASQHAQWLSVRQSAISENIANANTPGYKAVDTKPFEAALEQTRLAMAQTEPRHMDFSATRFPVTDVQPEQTWEVVHSGNTVSLEQELLKAGEVRGAYALNTSVVKAFHRMLLASTKG